MAGSKQEENEVSGNFNNFDAISNNIYAQGKFILKMTKLLTKYRRHVDDVYICMPLRLTPVSLKL
jgi:hypothetical protein